MFDTKSSPANPSKDRPAKGIEPNKPNNIWQASIHIHRFKKIAIHHSHFPLEERVPSVRLNLAWPSKDHSEVLQHFIHITREVLEIIQAS
jgi:hypothetical protein